MLILIWCTLGAQLWCLKVLKIPNKNTVKQDLNNNVICFYCKRKGHIIASCPVLKKQDVKPATVVKMREDVSQPVVYDSNDFSVFCAISYRWWGMGGHLIGERGGPPLSPIKCESNVAVPFPLPLALPLCLVFRLRDEWGENTQPHASECNRESVTSHPRVGSATNQTSHLPFESENWGLLTCRAEAQIDWRLTRPCWLNNGPGSTHCCCDGGCWCPYLLDNKTIAESFFFLHFQHGAPWASVL